MRFIFAVWALLLACYLLMHPCVCREEEDEESSESVLGESEVSGSSKSSRLSLNTCSRVSQSFGNIYSIGMNEEHKMKEVYSNFADAVDEVLEDTTKKEEEQLAYFYHKKPVPTRQGSLCEAVNITCCQPNLEKRLEVLADREYRYYYEQIFKTHSEVCLSPGKRLHKSFTKLIEQVISRIEIKANLSLDGTLPSDTFRNISNFLMSFTSVPNSDICPLPTLIRSQTHNLIQIALTNMFKDDNEVGYMLEDPVSFDCMKNVSYTFVKKHEKNIVNSLENQLQEIGVLVKSLDLAHRVITKIRKHQLSGACLTAITRMKYCAWCGGFDVFRPCKSLCLNTLKGCFADLPELHSDFNAFTSSLRLLSQGLITELEQSVFIESHFIQFVSIIDELRNREEILRDDLISMCSGSDDYQDEEETFTRKKRGGLKAIFQVIQDSKYDAKKDPILEQLDLNIIETVMEAELTCLERMGEKLMEVPHQVCYEGETQIAEDDNNKCWTGATFGNYESQEVGSYKVDQRTNPVYSDLSITTDIHYSELITEIVNMTSTIRATMASVSLCLQSDDEDCYLDTFQNCSRENPEIASSSGSGSGSGIESGSDGMEDMEMSTTDEDLMDMETTNDGRDETSRPSLPTFSLTTKPSQSTTVKDLTATQNGIGNFLSADGDRVTNPPTVPGRDRTLRNSDPTIPISRTTIPVTNEGDAEIESKFTEKDVSSATQPNTEDGEGLSIIVSSARNLRALKLTLLFVVSLVAYISAFNIVS